MSVGAGLLLSSVGVGTERAGNKPKGTVTRGELAGWALVGLSCRVYPAPLSWAHLCSPLVFLLTALLCEVWLHLALESESKPEETTVPSGLWQGQG